MAVVQDLNNCSMLHHAAIKGHTHVVKMLLSRGAAAGLSANDEAPLMTLPTRLAVDGWYRRFPQFSWKLNAEPCGKPMKLRSSSGWTREYETDRYAKGVVLEVRQVTTGASNEWLGTKWCFSVEYTTSGDPSSTDALLAFGWQLDGGERGSGYWHHFAPTDPRLPDRFGLPVYNNENESASEFDGKPGHTLGIREPMTIDVTLDMQTGHAQYRLRGGEWIQLPWNPDGGNNTSTGRRACHPAVYLSGHARAPSDLEKDCRSFASCTIRVSTPIDDYEPIGLARGGNNPALLAAMHGQLETAQCIWNHHSFGDLQLEQDVVHGRHMLHWLALAPPSLVRRHFFQSVAANLKFESDAPDSKLMLLNDVNDQNPLHLARDEEMVDLIIEFFSHCFPPQWTPSFGEVVTKAELMDYFTSNRDLEGQAAVDTMLFYTGQALPQLVTSLTPPHLVLAGSPVTAVQGLDRCLNITSLDISECKLLQRVDGLSGIEQLTITGCPALKQLGIRGCPKLRELTIRVFGLSEIGHQSCGIVELDLSGCVSLTTISGLSFCYALKKIVVAGCRALRRLNTQGCPLLEDVEGLSETGLEGLHFGTEALKILDCSGCSHLVSITFEHRPGFTDSMEHLDLSDCTALKNLQLIHLGISTLVLCRCVALTTLIVRDCSNLHSIQGLDECPNLEELYFDSGNGFASISGGGHIGCPKLIKLVLYECKSLVGLEVFAGCLDLEEMDIFFFKEEAAAVIAGQPMANANDTKDPTVTTTLQKAVEGLEELKKCPQLRRLSLWNARCTTSLGWLMHLPNLEELSIPGSSGFRLMEISKCPKLRTLNLSRCQWVKSVSGLGGCTELQVLSLGSCMALASIEGLGQCPKLQKLDLTASGVESVEGLAGCLELQEVAVDGCRSLHSISSLGQCPKLQTVVGGVGIEGYAELKQCSRLSLMAMPMWTEYEDLDIDLNIGALHADRDDWRQAPPNQLVKLEGDVTLDTLKQDVQNSNYSTIFLPHVSGNRGPTAVLKKFDLQITAHHLEPAKRPGTLYVYNKDGESDYDPSILVEADEPQPPMPIEESFWTQHPDLDINGAGEIWQRKYFNFDKDKDMTIEDVKRFVQENRCSCFIHYAEWGYVIVKKTATKLTLAQCTPSPNPCTLYLYNPTPMWSVHQNMDMSGMGDRENIWKWREHTTIPDLKRIVERHGYSAFSVSNGEPGGFTHACFKKFDYQLTPEHCAPSSVATIYIYNPKGFPEAASSLPLSNTIPQMWTEHQGIDMGGLGDIQRIDDWQEHTTLEKLKDTVHQQGYSAIVVTCSSGEPSFSHAVLLNFDYQLTPEHCQPSNNPCTIHIYNPKGVLEAAPALSMNDPLREAPMWSETQEGMHDVDLDGIGECRSIFNWRGIYTIDDLKRIAEENNYSSFGVNAEAKEVTFKKWANPLTVEDCKQSNMPVKTYIYNPFGKRDHSDLEHGTHPPG